MREEDANLTREEVLDLLLVVELGGELLQVDPHGVWCGVFDASVNLVCVVECRELFVVHGVLEFV